MTPRQLPGLFFSDQHDSTRWMKSARSATPVECHAATLGGGASDIPGELARKCSTVRHPLENR